MHLLDLPTEPVTLHHIVIELVPPRRGREFGAREFCERGEIEAVDETVEGVKGREDGGEREQGGVHGCGRFYAAPGKTLATMDVGAIDMLPAMQTQPSHTYSIKNRPVKSARMYVCYEVKESRK